MLVLDRCRVRLDRVDEPSRMEWYLRRMALCLGRRIDLSLVCVSYPLFPFQVVLVLIIKLEIRIGDDITPN